jgi:hypothetical protein
VRDPRLVNRAISLSSNFDRAIVWCEHSIRLAQGCQRADLVGTHEARVSGDISRQDGCQSSLDALARHEAPGWLVSARVMKPQGPASR